MIDFPKRKLDPEYQTLLEQRYNILDIIETKEFDQDPMTLIPRLEASRRESFSERDRYVIVLFDTDYFWHGHGIGINNLFAVWKHLDLPFYTLLLYTNHIGIHQQIEDLTKDLHELDRPTVIETFINPNNYDVSYYEPKDPDIASIDYHALCLMAGTDRSHRYATYASLKDLGEDRLVMTIRAPIC